MGLLPCYRGGGREDPPSGWRQKGMGGAVRHKDSAEGVWPLDRAVSAGLGLKTLTG